MAEKIIKTIITDTFNKPNNPLISVGLDAPKLRSKQLTGKSIAPVSELEKQFLEACEEQEKILQSSEFKKYLDKQEKGIIEYFQKKIAVSLSREALRPVLKSLVEDDSPSYIAKEGEGGYPKGKRFFSQAGQGSGWFFEESFFGLKKGNAPIHDEEEVLTELKHVGADSDTLNIGNIALEMRPSDYGPISSGGNLTLDDKKNMAAILSSFKMLRKMRNLLLFRTEWDSNSATGTAGEYRREHRIKELTLFLELHLKKVREEIENYINGSSLTDMFSISTSVVHNKYEDSSYSGYEWITITYEIKLKMKKASEAYNWVDLYQRQIDLLSNRDVEGVERRWFFHRVREILPENIEKEIFG